MTQSRCSGIIKRDIRSRYWVQQKQTPSDFPASNRDQQREGPAGGSQRGSVAVLLERYRGRSPKAGGQTSRFVIIAIGRACVVSLRHPQPLPRLWALPVPRLWAVVRYSGRGRTTVRRMVSLPAPNPLAAGGVPDTAASVSPTPSTRCVAAMRLIPEWQVINSTSWGLPSQPSCFRRRVRSPARRRSPWPAIVRCVSAR